MISKEKDDIYMHLNNHYFSTVQIGLSIYLLHIFKKIISLYGTVRHYFQNKDFSSLASGGIVLYSTVHRRRIELEDKAKVVASVWGAQSLPR